MADTAADAICLIRRDGRGVEELSAPRLDEIDRLLAEPNTMVWLALTNPGPPATDIDVLNSLKEEYSSLGSLPYV